MGTRKTARADIIAQIPRARKRSAAWLERATRVRSVELDLRAHAIMLELTNGVALRVPVARIPQLRGASAEQMARVSTDSVGLGLHWPVLDIDVSLAALAELALGASTLRSAAASVSGRAKSLAKSDAARRNGALGGRPKGAKTPKGSRN